MTVKSLCAEEVGLPLFSINPDDCASTTPDSVSSFELSSHERARKAIAFGLKMRAANAHIFVVGEDRSGRMTSTFRLP